MSADDIVIRTPKVEPIEVGDYAYVLLVRTDHEGDMVIAVAHSLDGAKAAATGTHLNGSRHLPEGWAPAWADWTHTLDDDQVLIEREYIDRSDRPQPDGRWGPIDGYVIQQIKTIP